MKTDAFRNKGLTKGGYVVYPQTLTDEAVRAGKLARFCIFLMRLLLRVREAGRKTELVIGR